MPDGRGPLALDDLYSPAQKEEIARGCFEVLLIQAEALAQPLPGQDEAGRREQLREALRRLDRADALLPDNQVCRRRRARYFEALGEADAARHERERAAGGRPRTALDALLAARDAWFEDHDLPAALRLFDRALQLPGNHFWVHFFRALAYQQQDLAEARASLTVCISERPDFLWAYLLRGFVHQELGARAAAEEERWRKRAGVAEADRARHLDGAREGKEGAYEAAEEDLDEAARLEEAHPDEAARYVLHVNRGVLRLRQGRAADAEAELNEAVGLRPGQYQAHLNLAQVYQEDGRLDDALAALDRAVALRRDQAALYRTRARLQLRRQDLGAAMHDLDEAIRLQGTAPPPASGEDARLLAEDHLERALILYRGSQYAEAAEACAEAVRVRDEFVVAYRLQGLALLQLAQADRHGPAAPREELYRRALEAFDRCRARGRPAVEVFRGHATGSVELGRYQAAVDDYTQALALAPEDAGLHAARGWAYLGTDSARLALADFEEAVRLDPGLGDAYDGRATALVRLGRLADAAADAEEAARRAGRDRRLLFNAARVYAQAVGRLDADATRRGRADLETRALYQDRAVALLRDALAATPDARRPAFWEEQVQKDPGLNPIRSATGFKRLAVEVNRAAR
jgi:tetratricopeptide (TPR) repeat protein